MAGMEVPTTFSHLVREGKTPSSYLGARAPTFHSMELCLATGVMTAQSRFGAWMSQVWLPLRKFEVVASIQSVSHLPLCIGTLLVPQPKWNRNLPFAAIQLQLHA